MASTVGDTLPSYSAFLDDDHHHPLYLDHPSAAVSSSFPTAAAAQEPNQPPPPAAEARKPRKRARASRRPPTTVLTTDASNFRAMVQEFTGFPAPPPFAPQFIGHGAGALFGGGPSPSGSAAAPAFHQLLRPSPLKLSAAATPQTSLFAHTLFTSSNANPTAAAAAAAAVAPSLSSELYSRFGPFVGGAVPRYDEGFPAMAEDRARHDHGLATSFLHAGDRYHSH